MKLQSLLERIDVVRTNGDLSVDITAVTADSRECAAGSLFIAIPGFQTDGAKFVSSAVERGAAAVVAEVPLDLPVPAVTVEDARAAAALIAANFYGRPAEALSLIGVTGTSGKTTTTKMIESILEATGEPVGLIGTIEYRAGDEKQIADRTTPDAIVLQEWFAKMRDAGVKRAVMEVSSHALALHRTKGVPFAAAVFTNLSRDHFDFHKNFEDYFEAKKILFTQIDRSARTAVVNADDSRGRMLADELGAAAMTFSVTEDTAGIYPASGFANAIDGLRGDLETPHGRVRIESALVGLPNLSNWMGAVGACLVVGIPIPQIEQGIRNLQSVRGRFERVPSEHGTVLIDYAHKPDAVEKLLRAAREMAPGRKLVIVFGCGGDRDRGKRPIMGEIAGRLADYSIITSDNPRSEKPQAIIDEILTGIRMVPAAKFDTLIDRREAIERGVELALEQGAVVVIAGKGHENYQVIGDRIVHFDDREEAQFALQNRQAKK